MTALTVEDWRQRLARSSLPWSVSIPPPQEDFRGRLSEYDVDDVIVTRWEATAMTASRSGERLAVGGDVVIVEVLEAGALRLRQDGWDTELGPAMAVAWRGDRPVRLEVVEPVRARRLTVPRAALDGVGCHLDPGEPVGDMPAVGMLQGYLELQYGGSSGSDLARRGPRRERMRLPERTPRVEPENGRYVQLAGVLVHGVRGVSGRCWYSTITEPSEEPRWTTPGPGAPSDSASARSAPTGPSSS